MSRLNLAVTLSIGTFSILFVPAFAEAHFRLTAPMNWWSQSTDGTPQKTPPCGSVSELAGSTATNAMNVYQSGQPVTITVTATVAHPGWWRVSLRQGAAATQNATNFPDPPELGAPGSAQQCTPAFMNNPVWSTTQPVIADKLGLLRRGYLDVDDGDASKRDAEFPGDDPGGRPVQHGQPVHASSLDDHDRPHLPHVQLSPLCRHGARGQRDRHWRHERSRRRGRARRGHGHGRQDRHGRLDDDRHWWLDDNDGRGWFAHYRNGWQHDDGRHRRHDGWRFGWPPTAGDRGTGGAPSGGHDGTINVMTPSDNGCSCSVGTAGATSSSVLLVALLLALRRRRRGSAS